jgi:hypothetical protein
MKRNVMDLFIDIKILSPCLELEMIYAQIPEKHDARGILLLAKSGTPVNCLLGNIY